MVKSFNHKKYWGNPMHDFKRMDFKSNTFEVLGLAIQFDRVINREVKFSSVFDWKINQSKFIAMPCWKDMDRT